MGLFNWLFGKTPAKQDREQPAQQHQIADEKPQAKKPVWKVGDRVLAKWHDSFFYPGRVQAVADKTCQVLFDDGDAATVHCQHMLAPDVTIGSKVFARLQKGPAYLPATVNQQKGESIHVRYDHGEEEWTTISFVRVLRPIADVGSEAPSPSAPVKQAVDLGAPVEDGDWRVGDRVLARWLDFYWYPGTILGIGQKGFHILYDDGDQRVAPHAAIMPLVVEEGESIFIRPKSEPQRMYAPATVTRAEGETLDVEYEDGQRENNTKVSRARFWRCPVGAKALAFEEGDRVFARDCDDCTYPAEIVSIHDDRVIVQFLDGPERMLTPELLRKFDLQVGAKIECRWKGGPAYFPGAIAKLEGERIFVNYDDGDQEWNSVRLVRLPKVTA